MSWTSEKTLKFIDLYKNEQVVWNPKHKYYKDRTKVQEGWNRLEYAMQVPVSELKRRKESLMTSFRLYYKKTLQSIQANEDEVYKPIWIFYEPLESFLKDVYEHAGSEALASTSLRQEFDTKDILDEQDDPLNDSCSVKLRHIKPKRRHVKQYSNVPIELQEASKEMTNAFHTLNQALKNLKRQSTPKEDDCDLYGRLLAKRLRQFPEVERQEIMYELDGLLLSRCTGNNELITNSDLSDS